MFRTVPTRIAALLVLIAGPSFALRANDVVPRAAAGAVDRPPRVLVLPRGRTLRGNIRVTDSGYEVAIGPNTGRSYIAKEMVWFTANSMREAYEILKKRYPDRTADGYVAIASWCIQQGLYDEARENLKDALQLEPDHSTARVVAEQLGKTMSVSPAPRDDGFARTQNRNPAAVARSQAVTISEEELTRFFVSRVQPILVNGCGNAACHGRSSESSFRLRNVRSGSPAFKSSTERNREMVQSFVNIDDPANSPLLTAPRDARHTAFPKPVFAGPSGDAQWQALAAWVNAAARSHGPRQLESSANSGDSSEPQPTIELAGATGESSTEVKATVIPADAETGDSVEAVLQHAIKSGAPDAFDPDDFNRRFAPRTDQLSTPLSSGPTR